MSVVNVEQKVGRAHAMQRTHNLGFTLIELMIVLVVAGILLFVALPGYENTVIKSNRNTARGVLMDVASKEEQHFINNKAYTASLADLGLPATYYVDRKTEQSTAADAIYEISLSTTGGGYTITATPRNRQTKDTQCASLTLNNLGVKGETGSLTTAECW